jgi:two-component system, cell cycle response regulator
MTSSPTIPRSPLAAIDSSSPAGAMALGDASLLGGSMFGALPLPASNRAAAAAVEPVPALRLAVKGLKPGERQLLEGLVKVSQHRTPRLEILHDDRAREADVVMVDAADPAAMAWAHDRPWLARRAVIWIDAAVAAPGHTLLPRPVQWPILPMVLARALEAGPETASAHAAATPVLAAGHAPHVLVVDDSPVMRAQLRSLLEADGYDVSEAGGVSAAMQVIGLRHVDCVLMDVVMPDADGYAGCHRMKAELRGADAVRIVMVTSRASPFDHLHGKMAGCDAYVTKPVDPRHLREVLAQQVGTPRRGVVATAAPVAIPTRRY